MGKRSFLNIWAEPAWFFAGLFLFGLTPCRAQASKTQEPVEPAYRSPVHVSLSPDGLRAYVVNQTMGSVSILDVRGRRVIDEIFVGSSPAHAALSPDGTTLYVSRRYADDVAVVDLKKRGIAATIRTGLEPHGLAISKNGERLYVANTMSDSVSILDTARRVQIAEVTVGRQPRFVAATPDGNRLVVANGLSRHLSIIDIEKARVVETRELDRANILRQVAVSPDGRWAYVNHVISHDERSTLQMERGWIHANGFSAVALAPNGRAVTLLLDSLLDGAANPWGMVLSADGRRMYVTLSGVHELAIVDMDKAMRLVDETSPEDVKRLSQNVEILKKRKIAFRVASGGMGPRGLALNEAAGEVLIANYFSDSVSILDSATGALRAVIELGPPQKITLRRKGEMLFNDARLSFLGDPPRAPNPFRRRGDPKTLHRGEKVFVRALCVTCHPPPAFTDREEYDLGLFGPKDQRASFDTPSLRGIYRTAPYLHDGRAKTLEAVITRHNPKNLHGTITDLSEDEMDDLLAYLRSL